MRDVSCYAEYCADDEEKQKCNAKCSEEAKAISLVMRVPSLRVGSCVAAPARVPLSRISEGCCDLRIYIQLIVVQPDHRRPPLLPISDAAPCPVPTSAIADEARRGVYTKRPSKAVVVIVGIW